MCSSIKNYTSVKIEFNNKTKKLEKFYNSNTFHVFIQEESKMFSNKDVSIIMNESM